MELTPASWIIAVTFRSTWLLFLGAFVDTSEDTLFCQWEYFSATCQHDEVILMQSAIYGRMKVDGECAKRDYGHLGCHVDVMTYMDAVCTGRRGCEFEIYNSPLRQMSVCPADIASYLEAQHRCLPVSTAAMSECDKNHYVTLSGPGGGYIASVEAEEHMFGTEVCPWVIQAGAGQTISVSLVKYAVPHDRLSNSQAVCYDLAGVTEADGSHVMIKSCDPAAVLYQSKSASVKVQLVSPPMLATLGKFVLGYQVVGCEDIKSPRNTTLNRRGQNLTVKCNNMDKTWYFVCEGNQWQVPRDEINCIPEQGESGGLGRILHDSEFPYGILIVVAIGVALGIFCGGLLLTCAYMYMKKRRRAQRTASGREADERFIVQEDTFPPPPDELLHHHHHPLTTYTDVHLKGHEDCLLHGQCTDPADKQQLALVYTKTKINPGMRTINGRHFYETPRFV